VIMGHEFCGAVKASCQSEDAIQEESASLSQLLMAIKRGVDEDALQHIYDNRARDRESVVANVRCQLEKLTSDRAIMRRVRSRELIIIGAFYEISSGIVDFFSEISADQLTLPEGIRRSIIKRKPNTSAPASPEARPASAPHQLNSPKLSNSPRLSRYIDPNSPEAARHAARSSICSSYTPLAPTLGMEVSEDEPETPRKSDS